MSAGSLFLSFQIAGQNPSTGHSVAQDCLRFQLPSVKNLGDERCWGTPPGGQA
jgi:hypothetical protein